MTAQDTSVPALVTLSLWGVPARGVPAALARMTLDRRAARRPAPLASRGRWSRRAPFGDPAPIRWDGPVAAITRARISPRHAVRFWRAVPRVSAELHRSEGLRLAVGIGEAPVGLQGTFSIWESGQAPSTFAYRRAPHTDVVRRTAEVGWYAEELFGRLAVCEATGRYDGRTVLG